MSDAKSIVVVQTIELVKKTYHVPAPITHPEYALDSVVCKEVEPINTEVLDEVIFTHFILNSDSIR